MIHLHLKQMMLKNLLEMKDKVKVTYEVIRWRWLFDVWIEIEFFVSCCEFVDWRLATSKAVSERILVLAVFSVCLAESLCDCLCLMVFDVKTSVSWLSCPPGIHRARMGRVSAGRNFSLYKHRARRGARYRYQSLHSMLIDRSIAIRDRLGVKLVPGELLQYQGQ